MFNINIHINKVVPGTVCFKYYKISITRMLLNEFYLLFCNMSAAPAIVLNILLE